MGGARRRSEESRCGEARGEAGHGKALRGRLHDAQDVHGADMLRPLRPRMRGAGLGLRRDEAVRRRGAGRRPRRDDALQVPPSPRGERDRREDARCRGGVGSGPRAPDEPRHHRGRHLRGEPVLHEELCREARSRRPPGEEGPELALRVQARHRGGRGERRPPQRAPMRPTSTTWTSCRTS